MALLFSAIRVVLGLFFLAAGAVKLTDRVSAEVYQEMVGKNRFGSGICAFPKRGRGKACFCNWQQAVVVDALLQKQPISGQGGGGGRVQPDRQRMLTRR